MSFIYSMADTWNAGGTTFQSILMNVTNTAYASDSAFAELQYAGATFVRIAGGSAYHLALPTIHNPTGGALGSVFNIGATNSVLVFGATNAGNSHAYFNGGVFSLRSGHLLGFSSSVGDPFNSNVLVGPDTAFARNAATVMEVNNGVAGSLATMYALSFRNLALTVASLAASVTAGAGVFTSGARLYITNPSGTTFATTVTGSGGAVPSPIYSDGTQWRIG